MDTMIAVHAKSLDAILVTNNLKHFGVVKGLVIKNWAE
jgi:tRNA(fMet)-specific endonuclease VapC